MKIEKKDSKIIVGVDGDRIKYRKKNWTDKENFLTDDGVLKLQEWKIDLVENHGVDLNELQD